MRVSFPEFLDYVRGEIIIGGGYPYVIETADQVAVLQAEDRRQLYRLLQDWSEKASVNIRFSRKNGQQTIATAINVSLGNCFNYCCNTLQNRLTRSISLTVRNNGSSPTQDCPQR